MIKFKRRRLRCWVGSKGYDVYEQVPEILEFQSEQDLLMWVKTTLNLTSEGRFKLTIDSNSVILAGVLGWINL